MGSLLKNSPFNVQIAKRFSSPRQFQLIQLIALGGADLVSLHPCRVHGINHNRPAFGCRTTLVTTLSQIKKLSLDPFRFLLGYAFSTPNSHGPSLVTCLTTIDEGAIINGLDPINQAGLSLYVGTFLRCPCNALMPFSYESPNYSNVFLKSYEMDSNPNPLVLPKSSAESLSLDVARP